MAYISAVNTGIADRVRAVFADVLDRATRRKMYRTTLEELNNLSGRELADLGIHRSEIKRLAYEAAYLN